MSGQYGSGGMSYSKKVKDKRGKDKMKWGAFR